MTPAITRFKRFLFTTSLALLFGCEAGPVAKSIPLQDIALRRHVSEQEWRTARPAPAKFDVVNLGGAPGDSILRLGLFASKPGYADLFLGADRVTRIEVDTAYRWRDVRVSLPRNRFAEFRLDLNGLENAWFGPCEIVRPGERVPATNVLVVLIDTLRKDHLGVYGYGRETSPNIDVFAKDVIQFTEAVPQSSWTKPSVASLMTSTYPNVHAAQDNPDILRDGLPTLAGVLQAAGYETHMLSTNVNVLPMWGFGREAFRFVDVDAKRWEETDDTTLVDYAIETLKFVQGRPWFMYVHAMGPHDPYNPPQEYAARFLPEQPDSDPERARRDEIIARYDAEIAYSDAQLGRLFGAMKALDIYDDTIIVLLSDHGEEFWEHGGQYHGTSLYEELLDVPLLIKLTGNQLAGRVHDDVVELVDVAPTLLELAGLPPEPRFQGQSLAPYWAGQQAKPMRMGYASLVHNRLSLRAVKQDDLKLIHDLANDERHWFDLAADPLEQEPILAPAAANALEQHAAHVAVQGRDGFHLLITWAPYDQHTVTGTVRVPGLLDYEFRYQNFDAAVARNGDEISFTFETDPWDAVDEGDESARLEFNRFAELYIEAPPDASMTVDLRMDGAPFPPEATFAREPGNQVEFAHGPLRGIDILGHPDAFDPARLPVGVHAYVWYVAPPESLPVEALDAETRETLKALGYLE